MGRLISGINGPIKGKIGTVIGSSWKGIPYVKGPYKKRTKSISKKEQANRDKFAMAQAWLKPLLYFVREGFKGYSLRSEGFVAAKSYLLKNAFEGVPPEMVINPSLVKLSIGDLPLPGDITVGLVAADQLEFTWSTARAEDSSSTDQVMMLAYNIDDKEAFFYTAGGFRKTGADVLPISPAKGKIYHLYIAFVASDRSRQSDSVYMGTINVL